MADPLAQFANDVRGLVQQALPLLGDPAGLPPFNLETPTGGQADLAVACFAFAKPLEKSPNEIAAALLDHIRKSAAAAPLLSRVEAQGGYVNFFVDRAKLAAIVLPDVLAHPDAVGSLPQKQQQLMLEHTSANPNGPLHVGRARNPIIGDTLVRIMRKAGWNVEAQYYLDDIGKQVAILAWGLRNLKEADLPPAEREKVDHKLVRYYQVANAKREADKGGPIEQAIGELMRKSEAGDEATIRQFEAAYQPILKGMLESLAAIGVTFDSFQKESDFIRNGETDLVIEKLQKTAASKTEEDGALYIDLGGYGIAGKNQKFYYRRRDGTSLYATRDVAYHFWKAERADRLVNVLGEDHKLQAKQVRICLELLGCKVLPEVVFYAFVSLPEGKMSTRRGNVVFLDDLVDEAVERAYVEVKKRRGEELDEAHMRMIARAVGIGALRYNIVRVQPEKGIQFKWEEAMNFDGASAPFLQYAYARCASLLRKAGPALERTPVDVGPLVHPSELELVRQIARLARTVEDASRRAAPHMVVGYSQDLATALNAFYRDCPVLSTDDAKLRRARLQLVEAARCALRSTLGLLGVPVLEEM